MRGKNLFCVCAAIAALLASAGVQPAVAAYVSIQHNLVDGIADTNYMGGVLTISQASDLLTLNDPTPLGGAISNGTVALSTNFQSYNPVTDNATFTGGSITLTFDYDSGGGPLSYEISGPITAMVFNVTPISSTFSQIDGEGLFTAATKNLPGSGIWPDGGGLSSIDALTLGFDLNLAGFDWSTNITQGKLETVYALLPDSSAVPDPATGLWLVIGSVGLLRRRRRT